MRSFYGFTGDEMMGRMKAIIEDRQRRIEVMPLVKSHFLDSGAFSLHKVAEEWAKERGKEKAGYWRSKAFRQYMDEYAAFIKANQVGIDLYANVDVIGDPERTWVNQEYLEKKHGLRPVPVVHMGSDLKWLRKYVKAGHEIVGLGGLVGKARMQAARQWIHRCFDYICDTPDRCPRVKVHGFGVTSFELMMEFPWWSVDSTSWIKTGVFGAIIVPKRGPDGFRILEPADKVYISKEGLEVSKQDKETKGLFQSEEVGHRRKQTDADEHYALMTERRKEETRLWLKEIGMGLGVTGEDGEVIEEGVENSSYQRTKACLLYYEKLCAAMPEYPQPWRRAPYAGLGLC
jgi:hypothetical protein